MDSFPSNKRIRCGLDIGMCHYFPQDALGTHGLMGRVKRCFRLSFRKECFKMRFPRWKNAWCHWSQFDLGRPAGAGPSGDV